MGEQAMRHQISAVWGAFSGETGEEIKGLALSQIARRDGKAQALFEGVQVDPRDKGKAVIEVVSRSQLVRGHEIAAARESTDETPVKGALHIRRAQMDGHHSLRMEQTQQLFKHRVVKEEGVVLTGARQVSDDQIVGATFFGEFNQGAVDSLRPAERSGRYHPYTTVAQQMAPLSPKEGIVAVKVKPATQDRQKVDPFDLRILEQLPCNPA